MARTKKTALYSLVGPSQGDGYACTIREVQNAGDGQTCQGFAPDTDLGLGALVVVGTSLFRQPCAFRHNPRLGCRDGVAEVGEKRRRGAKLFLHFVEAGDVGFLHPHSFRPRISHDKENKAVLAHDIHGHFLILFGQIRGESKIGLTKSIFISLKNYTNVAQNMLMFLPEVLGHLKRGYGEDLLAIDF